MANSMLGLGEVHVSDNAMENATRGLNRDHVTNGATHNLASGIVYNGAPVSMEDEHNTNGVNGFNEASDIDGKAHTKVVELPIGAPWPGESDVEREEVVRLMIAGLREIGYGRAAATLELESGYSLDPYPEVAAFRESVLAGRWNEVERLLKRDQDALTGAPSTSMRNGSSTEAGPSGSGRRQVGRLGIAKVDHLREARFLVAQQKYLELLEAGQTKRALSVLRAEITPVAQEIAEAAAAIVASGSSVSIGNLTLRSPTVPGPSHNRDSGERRRRRRHRQLLPGSWEAVADRSARHAGVGSGSMMLDDGEELSPTHSRGLESELWGGDCVEDEEDEDEETAEPAADNDSPSLRRLSSLSSYLMCGSPAEVRDRSGWSGVGGGTRAKVLDDMQAFIPPSHLFPHNRLPKLLEQAKLLQKSTCFYHVSDVPVSLLTDHSCPRDRFPSLTTHVLRQHADEVWRVEWHPSGQRLATAGADRRCIVWRMVERSNVIGRRASSIGPGAPGDVSFENQFTLGGHPSGVSALAWSPDGSILLTSSDCTIKIWNAEDGSCSYSMTKHDYEVSALAWLPDGKSFISGAMDQTIAAWSPTGETLWSWTARSTRILDIAVAPDGKRLVAVGLCTDPIGAPLRSDDEGSPMMPVPVVPAGGSGESTAVGDGDVIREKTRRVLVYDLVENKPVGMYNHAREITCVSVSSDSRFALINTSPDEVQLFSLEEGRVVQQYVGQKQGRYVIKSCFGGTGGNFILSGSEDGMVYAWHRETAQQIEVLAGHKPGTVVNAVAWNPKYPAMFASAGDDHTVRIWQAPDAATLPSSASDVF